MSHKPARHSARKGRRSLHRFALSKYLTLAMLDYSVTLGELATSLALQADAFFPGTPVRKGLTASRT